MKPALLILCALLLSGCLGQRDRVTCYSGGKLVLDEVYEVGVLGFKNKAGNYVVLPRECVLEVL